MDIFEWVDKKVAQSVFAAVVIGICAASVRAMKEKEKVKPFLIRLFSGAIMSGLIGYLIRDIEMTSWMSGSLEFAFGWASSECGVMLSNIGKKKISLEDDKKEDHEL